MYRDKINENDDAVHEKDTCVSGQKVSSTNISCRVVVLLLDASQSSVAGLFPSLFDLRYEFWRIQKLHEGFEMWDRWARAISVVKENFNTICTKSVFRVRKFVNTYPFSTWYFRVYINRLYGSSYLKILGNVIQTSNPCMKDSRDLIGTVETRSRNIVEIRDDDFVFGKFMSSSPNSLSSKSFVSCPSKRNDRVQWEMIRSYDASFDKNYFELTIRVGDYYWVLSWVFRSRFNVNRSTSIADWSTHQTAVNILLT